MKAKIPLWINILQVVILAILSWQTYACYFNPNLIYPGISDNNVVRSVVYVLAGRNAMMATISIMALVTQSPRFFSFAFLMHSLRDFQDMFIAPLTGGPSSALLVFFIFLIVFVTPEIIAFFKLKKLADQLENL